MNTRKSLTQKRMILKKENVELAFFKPSLSGRVWEGLLFYSYRSASTGLLTATFST